MSKKKKSEKYPAEESSDNKVGVNKNDAFKQSDPKKKVPLYDIRFKHNRSFELLVGRELLHFRANGINPWHPDKYSKGVPGSIVDHPDFQKSKEYFTITKQEDK